MIYIRKNGIFYENNFDTESEAYVFTRVESFISYLNETIHIDNEITLEDLFDIFKRDEDFVNIIFGSHMGHHPLRPYFDEIKSDCMPESQEEMDHIECGWIVDQFDYKKYYEAFKDNKKSVKKFGPLRELEGDEVNDITIEIEVYGWGKYQSQKGEICKKENKSPTHMSFALEFTPLYRIKHLPIKLNKKFIIKEEKYNTDVEITVINGEKEFTVFEVFGAILSEVTFVGLPEERDEQWRDVTDIIEEYREQMEEEEPEDDKEDDESKE